MDKNKKFEIFIEDVYDKFFDKTFLKNSRLSLCTIGNRIIPGYVVNETEKQNEHFFYTHPNYYTMKEALRQLVLNNDKEYFTFVETGCAAWGTKSTLLWDEFVNFYDGEVISVDLNKKNCDETNELTSDKTHVTHSDSLDFLPTLKKNIDFLYLDSYDVDLLNPEPSTTHHLKEYNCIKSLLSKNSVVLVDDTPVSPEWIDNGIHNPKYNEYKKTFNPAINGKGSYVNSELEKKNATKILHQYQTLWVIN